MAGTAVTALRQHIVQEEQGGDGALAAGFANLLPLAHGLCALVAEAAGRSDEAAAESLAAAVEALRAALTGRGVEAEEAATAASPGALYILLARFLLRLRVLPLARLALSQVGGGGPRSVAATAAADATGRLLPSPPPLLLQAEAALLDAAVPRPQRAEVLALKARWFLDSLRVSDPREVGRGGSGRACNPHPQPPPSSDAGARSDARLGQGDSRGGARPRRSPRRAPPARHGRGQARGGRSGWRLSCVRRGDAHRPGERALALPSSSFPPLHPSSAHCYCCYCGRRSRTRWSVPARCTQPPARRGPSVRHSCSRACS